MNRLIHYLLHESSAEAADEVSKFFVAPLLDFHRRLLAEGIKCRRVPQASIRCCSTPA